MLMTIAEMVLLGVCIVVLSAATNNDAKRE